MLRLPHFAVFALLLAGALVFSFTACGERDPKGLTDTATDALQARDYKTSLTGFEHALTQMDASHEQYMRASTGRCLALAHVDPAKGKDEFLKLAAAEKARISTTDVHVVVSEFVKAKEFSLVADIMERVKAQFPESAELKAIGDSALRAAEEAGDVRSSEKIRGLGYGGNAK